MSESIDGPEKDDDTEITSSTSKKSDFVKVGGNLISNINFKMAFFLFFIGMIIFSDLFIKILCKTEGTVVGECTTTKGSMIQLLVFVLCFLVLDLVMKYGWL